MKRLFIVASMAIMAVGCQKTTVENEVLTPIGFNTEVGKQTRAIVSNQYDEAESFGVHAFAWQNDAKLNKVMNNETIAKRITSGENVTPVTYAWKATTPYYWPNDANTSINFYAYSPREVAALMETEGTLTLAYAHTQEKINELDFMVATPVIGATFADQDGPATSATPTTVPVKFHHQMTQILFTAKTNMAGGENGVTFTLKSIKLKTIASEANFTYTYDKTAPANYGTWALVDGKTAEYTIYNDATGTPIPYVTETTGTAYTTPAVTMIPQPLTAGTQKFEVIYAISGKGVATETVTKLIDLSTSSITTWAPNRKVIYNLTVGLNEITFEPSVIGWDDDPTTDAVENTPVTTPDISIN